MIVLNQLLITLFLALINMFSMFQPATDLNFNNVWQMDMQTQGQVDMV